MEEVAYLVNSTPAYYYLLPLHFTLVRRYAPFVENLFLATEVPDHPICQQVAKEHGVKLIPLEAKDAGFLASRAAALKVLKDLELPYVLPVQEDFLVDRIPDMGSLCEAVILLEASQGKLASARLMPCPGAKGAMIAASPLWAALGPETDEYGFTYQATLWSTEACWAWYEALQIRVEETWPAVGLQERANIEIRLNVAENADGQRFFWKFFKARGQDHIGWIRSGSWSNAVYLSPWPYRPTAIVKGRLEAWAIELAKREGVSLDTPPTSPVGVNHLGRGY